jgi:hypothetical protein
MGAQVDVLFKQHPAAKNGQKVLGPIQDGTDSTIDFYNQNTTKAQVCSGRHQFSFI